ncbi:MAG: PQQ-binding-like beta-propeller repeat protein [Phycisphaerae bacterium]|nr:PQQ-binding-like beta-propeller repeat protein [Phycisphaerae bacterium]
MLNYAHRFTLAVSTGSHGNRVLCLLIIVGGWLLPAIAEGHDWPMWRYDAGRRAASPEQLPGEMHLQWVRELAPPKSAWPPSQYKLQFDASYEPVVAGKTVFVGSMVSDSVTAYDTETGTEKWCFYTDGPVRFAPVVYKNKLYVASDDGYLYCLNAETGSLIQRFLAGPGANKVLGNDRLIGMWPVRGGPVLYEGTVYFAAGIWPFMGTFIYAMDAESGQIVWDNSGSGSTFTMQPHSSPAFAGVAPQGYLVAARDKLLVSGGRSVPAAYDRRTGEFLYYHLNKYGKAGTSETIASGDHFFNLGAIHKLSDGLAISGAPASVIDGEVIIGKKSGDAIVAYKLGPQAKKAEELWQTKAPSELAKIHLKAGSRLYCSGGQGAVIGIDVADDTAEPRVSWKAKVDGEVSGMLAADGKLFVTTIEGRLYCFAGEKTEPKRYALEVKPLPAGSRRGKVRKMLETTGQEDGYCILLGLGSDELLLRLLDQTDLHIVALDSDAEKVEAMRRKLDAAGLYGTRAAVHVGDIMEMKLPPYMANLIVAEDLKAAGFRKNNDFVERVFHSLRPYGGTASLFTRQKTQAAVLAQANESRLAGRKVATADRLIMLTREGPLPGAADWTHQYGDSTNAVMSRDKSVKAPLGLLWFGGPANDKILPRHGHGPSPHVVGGRLFIEGRNMLRAVDVYTGRLLWETEFQDLGKFYDNTGHQPGANEIGSNYVSVSDAVYVAYGDKIHVLDPATGATKKEFAMPDRDRPRWGTLVVWEDLLLAPASPLGVPLKEHQGPTDPPEGLEPIIDKGADWQYVAGGRPGSGWMQPDFDAGQWDVSAAGFGYSDDDDNTILKDMRGRYSVVYIRKSFEVSNIEDIRELGLMINYDDAFIAYLNGKEVLRVGVGRGSGARASRIESHNAAGYGYFRIFEHSDLLREGVNVLAIEGHNDKIDSSDMTLDPYLVVVWNGDSETEKKLTLADLDDVPGVTVNADYSSGSKMLVAMNRLTGEVLWKRQAKYSFRHNAIVVADNKVFCIDGMTELKLAYLKRRGLDLSKERTVYALDVRTGDLLWKSDEDVPGTWLGYSTEHGILLQAGSASGDRASDEVSRGMVAYRGSDGKVLWKTDDSYKGPPILYHDWAVTQTGGGSGSAAAEAKVFNLLTGEYVMRQHPMTGETVPWTWVRFKGCNTAVASENLLTFRSASGAFVDLTGAQGTASLGGFKSGCTSNLIAANGVLNAPDYTRTCTCSYQNQSSLALVHMPEVAYWTFDYYRAASEVKAVKQVGINFGAPGNRYSGNGTLWLEFPSVGGPSPDIPVRATYEDPQWLRHHSSRIEGEHNWITASGVTGIREVAVRMFIQPGKDPSKIESFDKNIEKIPTWSEDQIKGAFEKPRSFTVRLYFAEIAGCEAGRRIFDVSLQGRRVLEDFDIAKEAGGTNRSVVKEFKGIGVKDDLRVTLTPAGTAKAGPLLNGIEIIAED